MKRLVAFWLVPIACGCSRTPASTQGHAPSANAPVEDPAASPSTASVSASHPTPAPSSAALTSLPTGSAVAVEYLGAVGGHPVRARLASTPASIGGRWVYESGGSPAGLGIDCAPVEAAAGRWDCTEEDRGRVTGRLRLDKAGASLEGDWRRPDGSALLEVRLSPIVRSRGAGHVLVARRILLPPVYAQAAAVGFLPGVEGPAASRMAPNLTLQSLLGESEDDLAHAGTATGLDFDVVLDTDRLLTIAVTEETLTAYPDSHGSAATFAWKTGQRIGAAALLPGKRGALTARCDERVHGTWRARKAALEGAPASGDACGPDVAASFMSGDAPSFTARDLDTLIVTSTGIDFPFDFDFPHVARACEPTVDLSMPMAEARPYFDPKGPLGGL